MSKLLLGSVGHGSVSGTPNSASFAVLFSVANRHSVTGVTDKFTMLRYKSKNHLFGESTLRNLGSQYL
jgi:hypothetical protein